MELKGQKCDPLILVLSLGVFYIRFIFVCKVHRVAEYILNEEVVL